MASIFIFLLGVGEEISFKFSRFATAHSRERQPMPASASNRNGARRISPLADGGKRGVPVTLDGAAHHQTAARIGGSEVRRLASRRPSFSTLQPMPAPCAAACLLLASEPAPWRMHVRVNNDAFAWPAGNDILVEKYYKT